ncbi:MAG: fructose-2,6-bisphosphatase [Myxococcales bacterium]|nr:MAG: fructose-2,6-bisphosphatase [Myxococcales bacterium]
MLKWVRVHGNIDQEPLVLALVGLPARGKSYTGRKIGRYLKWLGYRTRVFNVGEYRRERVGAQQPHDFFDPDNPEGLAARRELALEAVADMVEWFREGGQVAIYDATNSTRARRDLLRMCCDRIGIRMVYIEIVCDDPLLIEANILATKVGSPDYAGIDPDRAVEDFRARIAHYGAAYEHVDDDEGSYIRMIDAGRQLVVSDVQGYLPSRLVYFLMNLHLTMRPILLTRHGESISNISGRIGEDLQLAPRGERYARGLASWVHAHFRSEDGLVVWTSSLKRTIRTAEALGRPFTSWRALDEIDAGVCDGMTYRQIESSMPEEYAARSRDKLNYRYPRGESYQDVIHRIDPVVMELERQRTPVLIVAHQAVLRALYAYFTSVPPEKSPHTRIPLHAIIKLTPHAYGCHEERIELGPATQPMASSG